MGQLVLQVTTLSPLSYEIIRCFLLTLVISSVSYCFTWNIWKSKGHLYWKNTHCLWELGIGFVQHILISSKLKVTCFLGPLISTLILLEIHIYCILKSSFPNRLVIPSKGILKIYNTWTVTEELFEIHIVFVLIV